MTVTVTLPALIERVYDGKHVVHWRVSGKGAPVTVRTSQYGIYVCLTCISTECAHALAVREFDRSEDTQQ